jgi:hypothetical protein
MGRGGTPRREDPGRGDLSGEEPGGDSRGRVSQKAGPGGFRFLRSCGGLAARGDWDHLPPEQDGLGWDPAQNGPSRRHRDSRWHPAVPTIVEALSGFVLFLFFGGTEV